MADLAIIIPAYKITFFDQALASLAEQTNKNFCVYVGDDCSPHNIQSVCKKYESRMELVYHRFNENLGGKDLVQQWERCIALKGDEAWLWLFSDDDVAEPSCVEVFFEAIQQTDSLYDVYRFDTLVIDENGQLKENTPKSPIWENTMELSYNILLWKRAHSMPEHIFKFATYKESGLINFPFGQASDWATAINFAYSKGMYTIKGPCVRWRVSNENLSTLAADKKHGMIFGYLQFLYWVNNRFSEQDEMKYGITRQQIRQASLSNIKLIIAQHYKGIPINYFFAVVNQVSRIFSISFLASFSLCMQINKEVLINKVRSEIAQWKLYKKLKRFVGKQIKYY